MGRLFLKIFLSFWLSTVLIVGTMFLASERPGLREAHDFWQSTLARSLIVNAEIFVKSYEEAGCTSVAPYLKELSDTRIKEYLLDSGGMTLCGEAAPPQAIHLAASVRQHGARTLLIAPDGARFNARMVPSKAGGYYVLVIEIPPGMDRPRVVGSLLHLLLAVAISALICFWLARYLTAPVIRLRTAAHRLAAGDLTARAGSPSHGSSRPLRRRSDEIADLVVDFDHMAGRVESVISGQKRLIRDISHELRSPLARMSFALALARRQTTAADAQPLDRIHREADRMNTMIERMLNLSRLQTDDGLTREVSLKAVDIAQVVRDVVEDADFEAQSRECHVVISADQPARCEVRGNPELLRSALENVVRNALHYTVPHSQVMVTLTCDAGSVVLIVNDQGPGVPEADLSKLFRPFYRVDSARDRQSGGTGLGLAIAEQAVHRHGGTISAANSCRGGLEVTITLPRAAPEEMSSRG